MNPLLSIVTVNWNTRDLLRDCLHSVYRETRQISFEIFVIDNASADGSAEMVAAEFPHVRLIQNKENLGYGRANNQGLRLCQGKFILMLNPDTRIVANAIGKLIDFMEAHPEVGMTGPKTLNPDGKIQVCWALFPRLSTIFTNNIPWKEAFSVFKLFKKLVQTEAMYSDKGYTVQQVIRQQPVDYLLGEFMLTRKTVLDTIGLFDEDVFMYEEETDICYRIHQHGWEIWFVPEAEIIHYEKKSIKQLPGYLEREADWFLTARSRFYGKYYGACKRILFHLLTMLSSLLKLFLYMIYYLVDQRKVYLEERVRWHWYLEKWHLQQAWHIMKRK